MSATGIGKIKKLKINPQNDPTIDYKSANICRGCERSFEYNTLLKHLNHPKKSQCKAFYEVFELDFMKTKRREEKMRDWRSKNKRKISAYKKKWHNSMDKKLFQKQRANKQYYERNKRKIIKKCSEYYSKNNSKENKEKISKRKAEYYQKKIKKVREACKIEKSIESELSFVKSLQQSFEKMTHGKLKCFKNNCIAIYMKEIRNLKTRCEQRNLTLNLMFLVRLEKKINSFMDEWHQEIDSSLADITKLSGVWQAKYDSKIEEVSAVSNDWKKMPYLMKQVSDIVKKWGEVVMHLHNEKFKKLEDSPKSDKSRQCKALKKHMDETLSFICKKMNVENGGFRRTECHCHPVKDHCKGILGIILHGCNFTCKECKFFKVGTQSGICPQCRMEEYHMEMYGYPFTNKEFSAISLSKRKYKCYKDYLKSLESTKSSMEFNYQFKRSKLKLTLDDLDAESEEDSEYKANVGECGRKNLPKRKCSNKVTIHDKNDDLLDDESDNSDRSKYLVAYEKVGISLYDLL